jgi:hypothetical protein
VKSLEAPFQALYSVTGDLIFALFSVLFTFNLNFKIRKYIKHNFIQISLTHQNTPRQQEVMNVKTFKTEIIQKEISPSSQRINFVSAVVTQILMLFSNQYVCEHQMKHINCMDKVHRF